MKKTFLFAFSALALHSFSQSSFNYTINGSLKNATDNSYIYVHHRWDNKDYTDSVKTKNGTFTFNGKSQEPNMHWITQSRNINEQPNLIFFVDAGKISVTGHLDSLPLAKVVGGQTQKDYTEYNALMGNFGVKQQYLINIYNESKAKGDDATMNSAVAEYQALEKEVKNSIEGFIKTHSKSAVSCYAIYFNSQNANANMEDLERVVGLLDKSILNTKYGKLAQEKLTQMRGTTIGYTAVNFTQADPNGKMVNLSDLRGKYVLVDFWASWCGPCKGEIPFLKTAYERFHNKGFEIVSVSLDDKKQAWLASLRQFQMPWIHVSDSKGFNSAVNELYHVPSIPKTLLLDKTGKIIATDLRGRALDLKLEELLK